MDLLWRCICSILNHRAVCKLVVNTFFLFFFFCCVPFRRIIWFFFSSCRFSFWSCILFFISFLYKRKSKQKRWLVNFVCVFFLPSFYFSIAAACYTVHYVKRLYETLFIHRFSHATMPLMNLFKNCAYYWGFTAYVAYHVCHPLYTPPSALQTYIGLAAFAVIFFSVSLLKVQWF